MKLTALFFLMGLLQVSARGISQNISFSGTKVLLEKVFEQLEAQGDYHFLYDATDIRGLQPVTIDVSNTPVENFLKILLKDQPLGFKIRKNNIVISRKPPENDIAFPGIGNLLPPDKISGTILDVNNQPLVGATVRIKGKHIITTTNEQGYFEIAADPGSVLLISYVGFQSAEYKIPSASDGNSSGIKIILQQQSATMDTVGVVFSTGYQKISKERATGSFTFVDNALINRSVSTDILSRLDGVTSGVIFNKDANLAGMGSAANGRDPKISIRGRSTIFSNTEPLIILNDFPYEGDVNNINPNDVLSITVLKDAAAASIWGVRAGNGVIVITTKTGRNNQPMAVSFNSNVTVKQKPDVWAVKQMTSSDFIDLEKFLFDKGYYDVYLDYIPYYTQSPVIDILDNQKRGIITDEQAASGIDALRKTDVRNDLSKYFYKKAVNQQYSLNINGGSTNNKYYLSAGFDKNAQSQAGNNDTRITLNGSNSYQFWKHRAELNTDIFLTKSIGIQYPNSTYNPDFPYLQLTDANGNALAVVRDYRQSAKDAIMAQYPGLLDWNYRPVDERFAEKLTNNTIDYRINIGASVKLIRDIVSLSVKYQYQEGNSDSKDDYSRNSYYIRNMVNKFSQVDGVNTVTNYPFPRGGMVSFGNTDYKSHFGRGQINYNQNFNGKHELSALGGMEISSYNSFYNSSLVYGYDENTATNVIVDYFMDYPTLIDGGSGRIPAGGSQGGTIDHKLSFYGNASYTYNKKYTLYAIARRDESNLFGVKTNQKGVPLYSVGLSWTISNESFYHVPVLPYLKLRLSDGYNGNVKSNLSAYVTSTVLNNYYHPYNFPQMQIVNPPNPSLRWEKVHIINLGIDLATRNNRVTAVVDLFSKRGLDLIGNNPIAQQTGLIQFTGNNASTLTRGIEANIHSLNIDRNFKWTTTFLFNIVKDKIVTYWAKLASNSQYIAQNYTNPIVGKPYSAVFSYRWAGLDPQTGKPMGYLDGKVTENYGDIGNSSDISQLVYNGPSTPTCYGSLMNTFSYKRVELSFNIGYKSGYIFRRSSYSGAAPTFRQPDFNKHWEKPGDELKTQVPGLIYPDDGAIGFYENSEILIEKGDHVRFRDVQAAYTFPGAAGRAFKNLKVYGYVSNLGIIWKANKAGLDPDYNNNIPDPKTFAIGLNVNF